MKRFLLAAALLPCTFALPAHAQTTPKQHGTGGMKTDDEAELKAIQADMTAYGAWLVRLDAANQEATTELQNIQVEWQAAARGPSAEAAARFRPVVARAKAKVAEARRKVMALDTPRFPALGLDADAEPAVLVQQVLKLYVRIDALLDSFGPMLTAIARNDGKAVLTAAEQMLDAAQLLLDTQAILINAGLATADKEMGAYQVILLQVRLFQSASRVMGAGKLVMYGKQDPGLAKELDRYADEIDRATVEGRSVMTAKLAKWAELTRTGDSEATRMLRKTSAVLRVDLQLFDAMPNYSAVLRATAAKARAGRLAVSDIRAAANAFAQVRNLINEVSAQENAAMAGS